MSIFGSLSLWQVDAFSDRPFSGNPAAVCLLDQYPTDQWMQSVAAEMNLSETAFVVPRADSNRFDLRWFTPAFEVDLCGHATLATAHTLFFESKHASLDAPIRFETRSGTLTCASFNDKISMDLPATPPTELHDTELAGALASALGLTSEFELLRSPFDLCVVIEDEHTVRSMAPNFNALEQLDVRGIIVTASSKEANVDFISRFFAPRCGINEDPVTGSAHCCLSPYWSQRLGKNVLTGYQASARGGTVNCELFGDRVQLIGQACTTLEGKLRVPPNA